MLDRSQFICHLKSYIQPFERILAEKELEALAGSTPIPVGSEESPELYVVDSSNDLEFLLDRLTYWEQIHPKFGRTFSQNYTKQVRREATVKLSRNGLLMDELKHHLPFHHSVPVPNHRALRYGSHGIHEYRGKFFPQLVRSLLNISEINNGSVVVDPMCGSGTTPAEVVSIGASAIGIDLNPLSILISQVKCDILHIQPEILLEEYETLISVLATESNIKNELTWFTSIPLKDQSYLQNWFAPEVLYELDKVASTIRQTRNKSCQLFFMVCLSNILRGVSWQKDDDLRVRKQIPIEFTVDVKHEFLLELKRSVKDVLAFLYENQGCLVGQAQIIEGNAYELSTILSHYQNDVDTIITSPPYATALPYLDTDRLSLSYLNLLTRPQHRHRDLFMIGNREITEGKRKQYLGEYSVFRPRLTDSITTVIDKIHSLNEQANVGFRRRNLSALLAKYFLDMREVLIGMQKLLKPGRFAYVVVGNNYTTAGGSADTEDGEKIRIDTDNMLAQLGETIGLTVKEIIPMEMLTSRDIFRKNTSTAETIIWFQK